ncbi:MAG: TIM barrel protein [Holophagales bacterium]|nr:TIM barrel protein [Holophagales bacterium]MYD21842.1 TIM barrel protein [Holophagales bacterium]MYI31961.1 TIM barrel protein [Holophagales bacterium]
MGPLEQPPARHRAAARPGGAPWRSRSPAGRPRIADRRALRQPLESRPLATRPRRPGPLPGRRRQLPLALLPRPLPRADRGNIGRRASGAVPLTDGAVGAPRVALQLYTLRRQAEQNLEAALDQAAEAGYREIEWFGGLWGRTAEDLRELLSKRGLGLLAAHVPLSELEADPAGVMDTYRALHCQVLVCPWLDAEQRGDGCRAHYMELGRRLDLLSYRFRAGGFRFAYHNHEFEVFPFDDGQPERLGPDGLHALVSCRSQEGWGLELDIYWAAFAGSDPVALIRELGDRVRLLHLKDGLLPGLPEERTAEQATSERWFRPLGEGDVDIAGCVEAALGAGVRLFVVEQDETAETDGAPERDIEVSLRHLQTATAIGAATAEGDAP